MRTAAVLLAVLTLPLAAQERPDAEREKRARHAERALGWLLGEDAELRAVGRQQLLDLGRDAVPALEKKFGEAGLAEASKVLRAIDKGGSGEGLVGPKDLVPPEADLPKIDRGMAEKYVQIRYAEAMDAYRKGNYQKGYDVSNALLTLEAKSAVAERIRILRRACENMITQTTLLEAKVVQDRVGCVVGDKVELTLRMKNLYRSAMKIAYAEGDPAPADGGLAVLEIRTRVYDLYGASNEFNRTEEVKFETEIPIATGAQWEKKVTIDTAAEGADEVNMIEISVGAWSHPLKIETDGRPVTRRIQFEPALLRVLPKKCARFLENPLAWLEKTIEAGIAQETFLCSQVLPDKEKDRGMDILIKAMEKTENPKYREAVSWVLVQMTGEKHGADPKKWQEWMNNRGKKTTK